MIVRSAELYERVKYWILPNIQNRIKEGSIKAYFNSEVTEIFENEIEFKTPNGLQRIKNDFVLAMTGYIPDLEWLNSMGLKINEDSTPYVNEQLESSVKGIYLAGVVVGGEKTSKFFIENTRNHPELIINEITNKNISS